MLKKKFHMCDQLRKKGLPIVLLQPLVQARRISGLLICDCAGASAEVAGKS
jgi:hypothetical protein